MSGINNGDGFVDAILFRARQFNQMEMWQADTFDPVTIDRELGWAEEIGMNCMRVYLHHLVWGNR